MTEPEKFLEWLRPGGPWVLTAINPQEKMKPESVSVGPGEVEPFVRRYDGRFNIYVQVNPTRGVLKRKQSKADIDSMEFFHVDIDPREPEDRDAEPEVLLAWLEAEQARILARLEAAKPSGIVFSGGGYQAFWRLREPIRTGGDVGVAEEAERYNRALELEFGADSCHNIDRILRLPGTINVLDAKKRAKGRKEGVRAAIVSLTDAIFDASGFKMAPPKGGAVAVPVVVGEAPRIEDVSELDKWDVPDRIKVIMAQGSNPDEGPKPSDNSRSAWVFDVACGLVRSKVPDDLIFSILTDPGWAVSESVVEKGPLKARKYAIRQIKRAHEEVDVGEAGFQTNEKGKPYPNQHNIRVAIHRLGVSLGYDRWQDRMLFDGRALDDNDVRSLRLRIEREFSFLAPDSLFKDVVMDVAHGNGFHPVTDYLDDLVWDGRARLDSWIIDFGGAEDSPYVRAVSSLFLLAVVRRVRQPGAKFDEMLVLESPQGADKSSALAVLAVRDEWFADGLPLGSDSQKVLEVLQGKLIAEIAEMEGLKSRDIETLKAFLSRRFDKARMAYDRFAREVGRSSIFAGTTNNAQYLRDSTGNRRFWPVRVERFDIPGLRSVVDQLWAEAVAREAAGEAIRLDPSLYEAAAAVQEERRVRDPWADALAPALEGKEGKLRKDDAWFIVGVQIKDRTMEQASRLGSVMRSLGWETKIASFGGRKVNSFVKGTAPHAEVSLGSEFRDGPWEG